MSCTSSFALHKKRAFMLSLGWAVGAPPVRATHLPVFRPFGSRGHISFPAS